jgi:hypothetical protein
MGCAIVRIINADKNSLVLTKIINDMKKYYFCDLINEEFSFTIDYFLEEMKDRELKELEITEAVRELKSDYFYCKGFGELGEKSEGGCGKDCDLYEPRNGKNGICKEWRHARTAGNYYILYSDGKLKEVK